MDAVEGKCSGRTRRFDLMTDKGVLGSLALAVGPVVVVPYAQSIPLVSFIWQFCQLCGYDGRSKMDLQFHLPSICKRSLHF